jgi:hypothetical protein
VADVGLNQDANAVDGDASDRIRTWTDLYGRVCDSYLAVDDFRMKLLGLLPVATAGGVFVLLNSNAEQIRDHDKALTPPLLVIGLFGALFTLGLFSYELFGIKKCHYLIAAGERLERNLHVRGQFRSRPARLANFVNEPFASSIIYPGCMAAWLFLALTSFSNVWAGISAGGVMLVGTSGTLWGLGRMKDNARREMCVIDVLTTVKNIDAEELRTRTAERWAELSQIASGQPRETPSYDAWVDRIVRRLHEDGEVDCVDGEVRLTEPSTH